jgi:hypothetical protein
VLRDLYASLARSPHLASGSPTGAVDREAYKRTKKTQRILHIAVMRYIHRISAGSNSLANYKGRDLCICEMKAHSIYRPQFVSGMSRLAE